MILLTGANGHLGANLLRRLLRDPEPVRVFLRSESDNSTVDGLPVERAYGDLRDPQSVQAAVEGCDRIYHTAAMVSTLRHRRKEIYDCNVIGTRNLLNAALAAGVSKVVVSGSLSAVGHDPGRPADESIPFNPFENHLPYAYSKFGVERECLNAAIEGLPVVVAISCAILGPWDFKPSRMGRTLTDFANGRLRAYIPGGFEFVAARDIVEGHILAMQKGRAGQRYIISSKFLTVDELLGIFERVTGRRRPPRISPGLMAAVAEVSSFILTRFFPNTPQRFTPDAIRLLRLQRRADCSKARRELGYEPTPIEDAIQEAYDWFVERGAIGSPVARRRAAQVEVGSSSVPHLSGGLPVLGHAVEFHRNPVALLTRGRERHGEIFRFSLAGKRVNVLTEPSGNEAFFRAPDGQLSAREAYQFTVPMFGRGVAYDVPPELMDEQLGFLIPALRDARMQAYAQAIEEETEDFVASWGERGEFDLVTAMNELTVFNACRCLIGRDFRRRLSTEFAHNYHDLEAGVNLVAFLKPYWPLPAMRRRDRGRAGIVRLISAVLEERRRLGAGDDDFVDTLIQARYSNGRALNDDEIVGLLLTLIFAGQHTSAVMAAWTGLLLLDHPEHLERVLREQETALSDEPLTLNSLRRLPELERCLKEAERMYPPLVMLMRTILRDFTYQGHVLPAGELVMVAPAVTHRLPHIFRDPGQYDPDRFGPGREEDRRTQFSLIGFGGGKHRCIGMGFAYQQVKVIWTVLLRRFDLEPALRERVPDYSTFVAGPRAPCVLRYRRKQDRAHTRTARKEMQCS